MTEVIRQLHERKSVRIFENRPVPDDVKNEVIGAAFEAPTAGNMMFYTIIDVTDQQVKDQLAVLCDLYAFELMMAPYAISHLRMGTLLAELARAFWGSLRTTHIWTESRIV